MNIRPSAAIRQNYNEIADLCRKSSEPVFLTKNGEGDLVVMDIESFNRREKMSERRKYKVIVSDRAKQMLGVHIRFLAQVDKDAARNKKKELMEAMRSLAYSPNRFPFLNEPYIPCNKYHKMFVKNWYLILYQIEDDTVYVDYILDCRKEYNWLIR